MQPKAVRSPALLSEEKLLIGPNTSRLLSGSSPGFHSGLVRGLFEVKAFTNALTAPMVRLSCEEGTGQDKAGRSSVDRTAVFDFKKTYCGGAGTGFGFGCPPPSSNFLQVLGSRL